MARTTLSAQVATLTAQVEALTQALAAQQAQVSGKRADMAPKELVLNHNGKLRTPKQAANDLRLHEQREARLAKMSKKERKAHEELIANIQANKAAEQDRTRALEKALKVKAGSFKSTAVSVKEAIDAGWKPKATGKAERKEELKGIKAQIRA